MAKRIGAPQNKYHPDEMFSRYLIQMQSHVQELEKARFAILEEEDKINKLIQAVHDMIASGSDSSTSLEGLTIPGEPITDPIQSLSDTLKKLEDTILEFCGHFQQITHILSQPLPGIFFSVLHDTTQDGMAVLTGIQKILLFLVHGDIYSRIRVIHHYSHYDYVNIYPHVTLASSLEQTIPETAGLIRIVSYQIRKDCSENVRAIRDQIVSILVIVMADCAPALKQPARLNGTIPEECNLSELQIYFLTGLRTQISYQASESREFNEKNNVASRIFPRNRTGYEISMPVAKSRIPREGKK